MTTVLLTGFEPFGGDDTNISFDTAHAVAGTWDRAARLEIARLPVTFSGAFPELVRAVDAYRPDVVVCCGLASDRAGLTFERVAVNWAEARIPDNAGVQPLGELLDPTGPVGYFTTLPVQHMAAAAAATGVAASVSMSAGSFVCNSLFYRVMAHADELGVRAAGFVHIAPLDLVTATRALDAALSVCVDGLSRP